MFCAEKAAALAAALPSRLNKAGAICRVSPNPSVVAATANAVIFSDRKAIPSAKRRVSFKKCKTV